MIARSIRAANNLCDRAPQFDFGQNRSCSPATRDAGHRIVLDALISALDHELEAAAVAEKSPAAPGVAGHRAKLQRQPQQEFEVRGITKLVPFRSCMDRSMLATHAAFL